MASSLPYSGEEIRVREIGLRFSVPRDCEVLEWDRRAPWNVYPSDHIGRPRGTARAFVRTCSGRASCLALVRGRFADGQQRLSQRQAQCLLGRDSLCRRSRPVVVQSDGRQHLRAPWKAIASPCMSAISTAAPTSAGPSGRKTTVKARWYEKENGSPRRSICAWPYVSLRSEEPALVLGQE